jgi:SAM-dependent methyltransferase
MKPEANENIAVLTHRKIVMGRRVRQISRHMAQIIPAGTSSVLDVGAGTGEMAQAINNFRPELKISGVDVYVRPRTFVPVVKYDGNRLPFDDNSVDAVITVDVLHHCDDPTAVLKECARVSRKWVLIKDHVSDSSIDHALLRFMDWVGNRAHGVVLPYNYLSSKEWEAAFSAAGLRPAAQVDRIDLYPMPFELLFGGSLHCIHLLEKY